MKRSLFLLVAICICSNAHAQYSISVEVHSTVSSSDGSCAVLIGSNDPSIKISAAFDYSSCVLTTTSALSDGASYILLWNDETVCVNTDGTTTVYVGEIKGTYNADYNFFDYSSDNTYPTFENQDVEDLSDDGWGDPNQEPGFEPFGPAVPA